MTGVISLRHLPEASRRLAQRLSKGTGQSVNAVLCQALVSGLLVEVTKLAPEEDGTLSGLEAAVLARALRRHLSSAIDLLLEYGEHPFEHATGNASSEPVAVSQEAAQGHPPAPANTVVFEGAMGEDLDALGIGMSFSDYPDHQT